METIELEGTLDNFLLFQQLKTKLGPGMLRKQTHTEAAESRGQLNEAIENYFRQHIIWDIVSRSIGSSTSGKESEKDFRHPQAASCHPFYKNGARKNFCEGLADELICTEPSLKKDEKLTEEVESSVKDLCTVVTRYCDDCLHWKTNDKNWVKTFEKVVREQSLKVANLEVKRNSLLLDQKKLDGMILDYYKELVEGVNSLYELASLREKALQFDLNLSHLFSIRCSALLLKMNLVERKALCNTYTKESVPALEMISTLMLKKKEQLSIELSDSQASLSSYCLLGEAFEKLVAEYSDLTTAANRLRWSSDVLLKKNQALATERSTD